MRLALSLYLAGASLPRTRKGLAVAVKRLKQ